jgi:hypothetical protein
MLLRFVVGFHLSRYEVFPAMLIDRRAMPYQTDPSNVVATPQTRNQRSPRMPALSLTPPECTMTALTILYPHETNCGCPDLRETPRYQTSMVHVRPSSVKVKRQMESPIALQVLCLSLDIRRNGRQLYRRRDQESPRDPLQ